MLEPAEYLGIVLDPDRLAVLGLAAFGPLDVDEAASRLGVRRRQVLEIVAKLRSAGLLDEELSLNRQVLQSLGASRPSIPAAGKEIVGEGWTEDEASVLGRFFTGDRLKQIPAQRHKRVVVLERLAQDFEPGIRYEERQVNFMLQMYHRDYAALRRYMVDEGLLTRADGVYWRTGGRYVPAASHSDS